MRERELCERESEWGERGEKGARESEREIGRDNTDIYNSMYMFA